MKLRGERILNMVLLLLGLVVTISSFQIGFGEIRSPGPGLFPFFCGLILVVQNGIIFLIERKPSKGENLFERKGEIRSFISISLTFALWLILMPLLGWVLLTFLATLSFSKIMKLEGWVKPLILSLGNTAFSYLIFGYFLYLDLPKGFWP